MKIPLAIAFASATVANGQTNGCTGLPQSDCTLGVSGGPCTWAAREKTCMTPTQFCSSREQVHACFGAEMCDYSMASQMCGMFRCDYARTEPACTTATGACQWEPVSQTCNYRKPAPCERLGLKMCMFAAPGCGLNKDSLCVSCPQTQDAAECETVRGCTVIKQRCTSLLCGQLNTAADCAGAGRRCHWSATKNECVPPNEEEFVGCQMETATTCANRVECMWDAATGSAGSCRYRPPVSTDCENLAEIECPWWPQCWWRTNYPQRGGKCEYRDACPALSASSACRASSQCTVLHRPGDTECTSIRFGCNTGATTPDECRATPGCALVGTECKAVGGCAAMPPTQCVGAPMLKCALNGDKCAIAGNQCTVIDASNPTFCGGNPCTGLAPAYRKKLRLGLPFADGALGFELDPGLVVDFETGALACLTDCEPCIGGLVRAWYVQVICENGEARLDGQLCVPPDQQCRRTFGECLAEKACAALQTESACSEKKAMYGCTWRTNAAAGMCVVGGPAFDCPLITDQSACTGACAWDSASNMCAPAPAACMRDSDCGHDGWCKADVSDSSPPMCLPTKTCTKKVGRGETCGASAALACTGNKCSTGLMCEMAAGTTTGTCVEKVGDFCSTITDEAECASRGAAAGCRWDSAKTACITTPGRTSCRVHTECAADEWCRPAPGVTGGTTGSCADVMQCTKKVGAGKECGGSMPPCFTEKCMASLTCVMPPNALPGAVGVCTEVARVTCQEHSDCAMDEWCRADLTAAPGGCADTKTCRKKVGEGQECGGTMPPCFTEKCKEGLECVVDNSGKLGALGVCTRATARPCQEHSDCESDEWCRADSGTTTSGCATTMACRKKVGAGKECGGSRPPCFTEKCKQGLTCVMPSNTQPGALGMCKEVATPTTCQEHSDCASDEWCRAGVDTSTPGTTKCLDTKTCVKRVGVGKACEGFTQQCYSDKCRSGLKCDRPANLPDAPGKCVEHVVNLCSALADQVECAKFADTDGCSWDGTACKKMPGCVVSGVLCRTAAGTRGVCTRTAASITCQEGTNKVDDCTNQGPFPLCPSDDQLCYDPDRTQNGKFSCVCRDKKTMQSVNGVMTCVAPVCPAEKRRECFLKGTYCKDGECDAPMPCPQCPEQAKAGCIRPDPTRGPDGNCPLFPCLLGTCASVCSAVEKETCRRQAWGTGPGQCEKTAAGFDCVSVCPMPFCVAPEDPEKCHYVPDDRTDPITSCPLFPCGKLMCEESCSFAKQRECATAADRRMTCEMVDGKATCMPMKCPEPSCIAPAGCRYKAATTGTLAATDVHGCLLRSCGELECGCTREEQKSCCEPSMGLSNCRQCLKKDDGTTECVARLCTQQRSCLPTPGCWFADAAGGAAPQPPGECPTCGEEMCNPYDPCEDMQCAMNERCFVVAGGEPRCGTRRFQCTDCERTADPCDTIVCPDGSLCVPPKTATGKPECLTRENAMCGGACGDDEECRPKREGGLTAWACVASGRRTATDLCTLDECACSGFPCEDDEVCVAPAAGEPRCAAKTTLPLAPGGTPKNDPCASTLCAGEDVCVNVRGLVKCAAPRKSLCGARCPAGEYCQEETGACTADSPCVTPCDAESSCVAFQGVGVCVSKERQASLCGRDWTWMEHVCRTHADCDDGFFCPDKSSTRLDAFVSEFCSCNPLTGDVGECTATRREDVRRCLPKPWGCRGNLDGATEAEKGWCCRNMQIGCPTDRYVCRPSVSEPPEEWNTAKKAACCAATRMLVGCVPVGGANPPQNCYTDEVWGFAKRKYCCSEEDVGCPVPEHDCRAGAVSAWAAAKATWCCREEQVGCDDGTAPLFDCRTRERWSREKRRFCCETEGLGCEAKKPEFDCTGGDNDALLAATQWTEAQKKVCCAQANIGCEPDESTTGPYRCEPYSFSDAATATDAQERRRKWCCHHEKIGCRAADRCLGLVAKRTEGVALTKDEKQKCCATQSLGCAHVCPSDPALVDRLTAEQKLYCCDTKGISCASDKLQQELQSGKEVVAQLQVQIKIGLKIEARFADALENPKKFVRLILRGLAIKAIQAGVEAAALLTVEALSPLTDDLKSPPADGERGKQRVETPHHWGEEPWENEHAGDLAFHRRQNFSSTAPAQRAARVLQGTGSGQEGVQVDVVIAGNAQDEVQQVFDSLAQLNTAPQEDSFDGRAAPITTLGAGVTLESGAPPPPGGDDDDDDGSLWMKIVFPLLGGCLLAGGVAFFVHNKRQADAAAAVSFADLEQGGSGADGAAGGAGKNTKYLPAEEMSAMNAATHSSVATRTPPAATL